MNGDRWTVLLVRDEDTSIRQYHVSPHHVHYAVGGAAALGALLVILAMVVGTGGAAQLRAERLARENAALTGELEKIQNRVEGLEGTLSRMSEKNARFRVLAGLDSIDGEVLQVGVGGPGSAAPEDHPLWAVDSTLSKSAFAVSYDLNALERRARLLDASLREATDSLQAHQDLLESTPSILPTAGLLSSRFSRSRQHPIHHRALPHEGIDLAAPEGTPIMAAAHGRVVFAGRRAGYGLLVEVDHGYGYTTRYGHGSKLLVRRGQQVRRGEVIAQVGSTGIATASHLHYEVRIGEKPVNPLQYVITDAVP